MVLLSIFFGKKVYYLREDFERRTLRNMFPIQDKQRNAVESTLSSLVPGETINVNYLTRALYLT